MNHYRPMPQITPAVKIIIIINVLFFVASNFLGPQIGDFMMNNMALYPPYSSHWAPYQYVTYMFMHGSLGHLFFNMFATFMFGRVLEWGWGSKRFLFYFFFTGIGAALLNNAIGWFELRDLVNNYEGFMATPEPSLLADALRDHLPNAKDWVYTAVQNWINDPSNPQLIAEGKQLYHAILENNLNIPTIGASGAVFGILLAFGMLFPNSELYLMFIPIPIKAKYFVFGYGCLELVLGLQNNPSDNIAHFAHLGGMLFGFILLMIWKRKRTNFY